MKEFFDSLLLTSKDRLKNPLIGAFIISWIVFNWKPLLILFFSDKSIEEKIYLVSPNGFWEAGFWVPLIIAVLYLILMPYVLVLLEKTTDDSFYRRRDNFRKRRLAELKASREIVREEVELERLKAESKDVAELNESVQKLKAQIEESDAVIREQGSIIENLELENSSMRDELSEGKGKLKTNLSEGEKLRRIKRFLIDARGVLNDQTPRISREIFSHLREDKDKLMKRILTMFDGLENSIIDLTKNYPKIDLESTIIEIKDLFNSLEDNIELVTTDCIKIGRNPNAMQDHLANHVFKDLYSIFE